MQVFLVLVAAADLDPEPVRVDDRTFRQLAGDNAAAVTIAFLDSYS